MVFAVNKLDKTILYSKKEHVFFGKRITRKEVNLSKFDFVTEYQEIKIDIPAGESLAFLSLSPIFGFSQLRHFTVAVSLSLLQGASMSTGEFNARGNSGDKLALHRGRGRGGEGEGGE